jgi:3-hydroxyisobutyrate dehydrogenase-like beta-hydroxyacid dehydrogenase
MTTIAFLGTGLLGSGFVEAACQRGDTVTVWNRTIDKARALQSFGAIVADTPAEAVRGATRVHLVLKDDAVVEDVIAQLRPGLSPDAIIVDHTTTQPALTAERATRLSADGVHYLHCPVFIGPAAARQSQGIIIASGPTALYESVKDALAAMAVRVEYFGERPDLAAAYKLSLAEPTRGMRLYIGRLHGALYEAPCYRYPFRTDRCRVFQVFLPCKPNPPEHWCMRGMALLCITAQQ